MIERKLKFNEVTCCKCHAIYNVAYGHKCAGKLFTQAEMDKAIEDTKRENLEIRNALIFLIELKKYKDEHGKNEHYKHIQPEAWKRAIKAVGGGDEY